MRTLYALLLIILSAGCSPGSGVSGDASTTPPDVTPPDPPPAVRIVGLCFADRAPNNDGLPPEQWTLGDCALPADGSPANLGTLSKRALPYPQILVYAQNTTGQQFVGYAHFAPEWGCAIATYPRVLDPGPAQPFAQYAIGCPLTSRQYLVRVYLIEAGTLRPNDEAAGTVTVTD